MATNQTRQESHRIYLQRVKHEFSISTSSVAIRLTSDATCKDVTQLLRKKFNLSPVDVSPGEQTNDVTLSHPPLVNRIHAHLRKVRGKSPVAGRNNKDNLEEKIPYSFDSKRDDTLVLVATCSVPRGFIIFEHETDHFQEHKKVKLHKRQGVESSSVSNDNLNAFKSGSTARNPNSFEEERESVDCFDHESLEQVSELKCQNLDLGMPYSSSLVRETSANPNPSSRIEIEEPINIVRTIMPHQNPLQIKDKMINYIQNLQLEAKFEMEVKNPKITDKVLNRKTSIIRWFFMPCHIVTSKVLNKDDENNMSCTQCIDIEGYCTDTMTYGDECSSNDSDDDENTSEVSEAKFKTTTNSSIRRWKQNVLSYIELVQRESANSQIFNQTRLQKERHRLTALSRFKSSAGSKCVSGYLLKQSKWDDHVWKKVHCILTDDQFWHVSRAKNIQEISISEGKKTEKCRLKAFRIGKYSIINLKGALLRLTLKMTPLSSTPFTFELMTKSGASKIFRALNSTAYLHWTQCLSERIERCDDNATFDLADIIVSEETFVKAKRCEDVLMKRLFSSSMKNSLSLHLSNDICYAGKMQSIVCFALGIAEYKELCRHIHKNSRDDEQYAPVISETSGASKYLHIIIFAAWKMAKSLLKQAQCLMSVLAVDGAKQCQSAIELCQIDVKNQIDKFHNSHKIVHNTDGTLVKLPPPSTLFDPLYKSIAVIYVRCD